MSKLQISLGAGKASTNARRTEADPDTFIGLLDGHTGTEAWWSPCVWRGDRRSAAAFETAGMVALDVDFHDRADRHAPMSDGTWSDVKTVLADFQHHAAYRTPRGFRVVAFLDAPVTSADAYTLLARVWGAKLQHKLDEAWLGEWLRVDMATTDAARLFYAPKATVNDERRDFGAVTADGPRLSTAELLASAPAQASVPPPVTRVVPSSADAEVTMRRLRAYIAKMPEAISGQGGHVATFNVANVIAAHVELNEAEMWELLTEYNGRCQPPWSEWELRHKLDSAVHQGRASRLADRPTPGGALADLDVIASDESASPIVCLADVAPERITWLWRGRIPLGKVSILEGDPGLGKSTLTADLAARLSRGEPFPDGSDAVEPAATLYISHEDGLGDTLRPRLEAACADVRRVFAYRADVRPTLPADIPAIERQVRTCGAKLVIIDPLFNYLSGGTDAHSDHQIRLALSPLAAMAEATGAAVLIVRHLNKKPGVAALYRGGGSIGISGIARSVLVVAKDPDDPDARVLAQSKGNLGPPPKALAFGLRAAGEGEAARIDWRGESAHTADELLNVPMDGPQEQSALEEAKRFLREELPVDEEVSVKAVKDRARQAGISEKTLDRARRELGIVYKRNGFGPGAEFTWRIPASPAPPCPPKGGRLASMEKNGREVAANTLIVEHNPLRVHPRQTILANGDHGGEHGDDGGLEKGVL